jgi:hypothetical protein
MLIFQGRLHSMDFRYGTTTEAMDSEACRSRVDGHLVWFCPCALNGKRALIKTL